MVPLLLLALVAGADPVKQDLKVELFYSGVWNDHTADAYVRDGISISHGAGNEQTGLVPSEASLTFQGRDGRMNPANIRSPLHGLIGRNTPIRISVGGSVRFSGEAVSWKPRRAIKGDAWVNITAQGTIRRLGQGEPPVESALMRTIVKAGPIAYWSLEEESQADRLSWSLSPPGSPMDPGTSLADPAAVVEVANDDTLRGSKPVVKVVNPANTGGLVGTVPGYADTGKWAVTVPVKVHTGALDPEVTVIRAASVSADSPYLEAYIDTALDVIEVRVRNTEDSVVHSATGVLDSNAVLTDWALVTLISENAGTDAMTVTVYNSAGVSLGSVTTAFGTTTHAQLREFTVIKFHLSPATGGGASVGHPAAWSAFTTGTDDVAIARAMHGYETEKAGARFTRLCAEEAITATIVGTSAETQPMGPQFPDTTLGLLAEIKATDNGMIFDTRSQLGLTFRTGRSLYNQ